MIKLTLDVCGVPTILAFVTTKQTEQSIGDWEYGLELIPDGNDYDIDLIHDKQKKGCPIPMGIVAVAVKKEIKSTPKWIYFNLEEPHV